MCYSPSEAMDAEKVNNFTESDYEEFDLPPEYCRYHDDGYELASTHLGYKSNCLDCPFPQCIYDAPRGRQRYTKRLRDQEITRLFNTKKKGIKELALMFCVSQRTIQRALKRGKNERRFHSITVK
jgi:hypothetical protein